MKRFFHSELETFRSRLVLLGEKAIEQVRQAVKAVVDHDVLLAAKVEEGDEELDRLEVEIDMEAIQYLSLRAPVATELRLIVSGMKVGDNLERVGDEATNIARRVKVLVAEPPLKPYVDIPRMAALATGMIRDALDSFLEGDEEKAVAICKRDAEVDLINKQLYRELTSYISENPKNTSRAIELMFISKGLERIADHATNLAEENLFLLRGEDVRHTPEVAKDPQPEV
jgi:phosphate transport system protein